MKGFVKEINIECSNCNKRLNKDDINIPTITSSGKLLCKDCLSSLNENINTVNRDNDINSPKNSTNNFELLIDNKYLLNLFNVMKQNNFSLLSFTYCNTCSICVASYSSLVHSIINHKIFPINKYTFVKLSQCSINFKNSFFMVLYYFQNPDILKIQQFNIKEFFHFHNYKFFFFGETIEENDDDIINEYMCNNLGKNENNHKKYKIKKGMLIGKDFLMNGFFLCCEFNEKSEKNCIIEKGFGILVYEKIQYIGFVKIFNSINSGFSLENGILNENKCFYIGKFNEEIKEYPLYTFELGEIINYNDENNITVKRKIYEITYDEYFNNNHFFIYVEIPNNNIDKIYLSNKHLHKIFNKIYDIKEVNVEIQISIKNNKRDFVRINQVVLNINKDIDSIIKIEPLQKITEQLFYIHLPNCKVYKQNKKINLLIDEDQNAFIISDQYNDEKTYIGYLIDEKQLINDYKNLTIYNTIHNYNDFIKIIDDLLNLKLENCDISLKFFKKRRIEKNKKYIKINAKENRFEIYESNSLSPQKKIKSDNLNEMEIENILPNIYSINLPNNIRTNLENIINGFRERSKCCFIY